MKKRGQWRASCLAFLLFSQLTLSGDDNSSLKNSYMVPTGRVILAPDDFADDLAVSSLIEFGPRDGRVGGTIAFQLDPCNRLKLSGEYLGQKLTYSFSSGKTSHWVQQAAFGADYQLLVDKDCLRALDFNIYSAHAPSKKLSAKVIQSSVATLRVERRIAGSNSWGGAIGTTWTPTTCDLFNIDLDWDHVRYKKKFSREKTVSGIGGTVVYTHRFPCCIDVSFEGQFRRPYNYLGAKINWNAAFNYPQMSLALFGGHTRGKIKLPSSSIIGIELSCALAICEPRQRECCPPLWNPCDLVTWAMDPAIYMPEVLAISEERRSLICTGGAPTSLPIPDMLYNACGSGSFPLASYFSANNGGALIYSFTTPEGAAPGMVISIDPITGVLSYFFQYCNVLPAFPVTVTATNSCGSTSQTFTFFPNF